MKPDKSVFLAFFLALFTAVLPSVSSAVVVRTTQELVEAVEQANAGGDKTILLEDGTYTLDDMLWIDASEITVAGRSGNRNGVIVQGQGMAGPVTHIFNVNGDNFAVRGMTLRRVSQHAIQLQLDIDSVHIDNLHILDTGEQMVKVAYDANNMDLTSDNGIMERCLLEYSTGVGPQWYIGGIDAHNAKNWIIRNNVFKGIRSPSIAPAEHAVHFWSSSENTLVERNNIINCDRGIGFGLGGRGHTNGIIRNNMIYHDATEGYADVGIGLESAVDAQVYNNTIYHQHSYPNAIEYRFTESTNILIANNLTNKAITPRDGGSATLSSNVTSAQSEWFRSASSGDLHLASKIEQAIDQGLFIAGLVEDFDGDVRPQGIGIDIGADEFLASPNGNIFNTYSFADGNRKPSLSYEQDRLIAGDRDEPTTLSFRLSLYGSAKPNLPLLVQVHEWGGDFARQEELAGYVPAEYEFVMLYFQYKPSDGNTDDWWFGTHWDGVCRMWAHDAIIGVVREALDSSLIADHLQGATVDRNRVYLFGHSIGGTGAWQLGIRNSDLFAAIHAHSGFARFTPPVGPFQQQFEDDIIGAADQGVVSFDQHQLSFPARDYSDLAWWLQHYRTPADETPFICITAGVADDIVPPVSGGDLMGSLGDIQKRGFFYHRHSGGHSDDCFVEMNWLWNFRLNQSFLAFTNRSGYGIGLHETVNPGGWSGHVSGGVNDLYEHGWEPASIVDQAERYEVRLTGSGVSDVTLRRLQRFVSCPNGFYRYWLDAKTGPGVRIRADQYGLITAPQVPGAALLIIEPDSDQPLFPKMLWTHENAGLAALWTLDGSDNRTAYRLYGPYAGWEATSYYQDANDTRRILWCRKTDGLAALWTLDANDNRVSHRYYGPYPGWTASSYFRNVDATARILWSRDDGLAALWTLDASDNRVSHRYYGPYPGWTASSYFRNADGTGRILWSKDDGLVALWTLDANDNRVSHRYYGPYPGWTASSYFRNADGTGRILWSRDDGLVALWTLDANDDRVSHRYYGPYAGWSAESYN